MSFTTALCTSCLVLASIRALAPQKFMSESCYGRARQFSQLRRKTPSRMTLSPRVSQQATPKVAPNGQRAKPRSAGPFGGMNMRQANIRGEPERRAVSQSGGKDRSRDQRGERRAAPRDDFKALKMQRALSPISYSHRTAIKSRISDIDTFSQFPLLPTIQEAIKDQALKGLKEITPTPVQRLAIPELLGAKSKFGQRTPRAVAVNSGDAKKMEQYLLAAETGSGKTLAYLLPTIDAIKRAETLDEDVAAHQVAVTEEKRQLDLHEIESPVVSHQPHPTTGRPRAIILVPTAELVSQVGNLIKALSHTIKFRSALISSAYTGRVVRNRLFSPAGIDILVSTPHLLASIAESDPNILSRVTHLIIDEADSLLDRSFSPLTTAIIDRATPSLQKLILCSATIPRSLDTYLRQRFPDIRRLVTPNLHAIPRRVQLGVVDVDKDPYHGNKNLACADTIYNIGNAAAEPSESSENGAHDQDQTYEKRILVFVNEREHAKDLANFLVGKGIDAHALTRDTPEQRQSELLKEFTDGNAVLPSSSKKKPQAVAIEDDKATYMPANALSPAPRRTLAKTKVLVTTDLGSRGIDTLAVRHVILYDVPHTTIDFIHRLGRTGRMGRRGRAVVLVGRGDRRDVVREVRDGMYKGQALI